MKFLKYLIYTIIGIVLILLVLAYFAPGQTKYSKSIVINASVEKVWQNINSMEAQDKWSPWNRRDPNMKKNFIGQSGTPGSEMCWMSPKHDVGSGCQKIVSIEQNKQVNTKIMFKEPFASEAEAYVSIAPTNQSQTKATWGFESETPYPWRIMNLFMNMEEMLDPDYTEGLNNLKRISEQP